MTGPGFDELVGDDLPEEEAARLRHVHELLVQAGPPAELPPSLAAVPSGKSPPRVTPIKGLPRRRLGASLLIAAALAAAAFGGGYLLGHRSASFTPEQAIQMHAPAGAPRARASLQLAGADRAGNSPIRMIVTGLPNLGKNGYYELYLTRGPRRLASCGTFVVKGRQTTVGLNAPYLVPEDANPGWVVVAHFRGKPDSPILLTT